MLVLQDTQLELLRVTMMALGESALGKSEDNRIAVIDWQTSWGIYLSNWLTQGHDQEVVNQVVGLARAATASTPDER